MSDILRLFFIIVLLTIGLTAYFLVVSALFANRVAKAQCIINQMPARAIGVGLVNFLFFGVIATILFSVAENTTGVIKVILTIPALLITALLTIILSFGLAGMVNLVGDRILPEHSSLKKTLWGSVMLTFACAIPFAGWFLLLPYVAFLGFGAVILGFFQRDD
jgi:sorbitol-specific phosphotransferase system component IIBC